jgi:hypothetical protein
MHSITTKIVGAADERVTESFTISGSISNSEDDEGSGTQPSMLWKDLSCSAKPRYVAKGTASEFII